MRESLRNEMKRESESRKKLLEMRDILINEYNFSILDIKNIIEFENIENIKNYDSIIKNSYIENN